MNPNIKDSDFDFFMKGIILTNNATKTNDGKNIPKLAAKAPLSPLS